MIKTLIVQPKDNPPIAGPLKMLHTRSASVLSDTSTDGDHIELLALADVAEDDWVELVLDDQDRMSSGEDQGSGKVEIEDAEDELEEGVQGPKDHIHDWAALQSDIKELMKKKGKSLLKLNKVRSIPTRNCIRSLHSTILCK